MRIDPVDRDGTADGVRHVGEATVVAHHHPAGSALVRGHCGVHKLKAAVVRDDVGGEGSRSRGIVEIVANEELVAITEVEAEGAFGIGRNHRGSAGPPVLAHRVGIVVVGDPLGDNQYFSIRAEPDLSRTRHVSAQRPSRVAQLRQFAFGTHCEPGDAVYRSHVAARVQHVYEVALQGHADRL